MARSLRKEIKRAPEVDAATVLNAIPDAVLVIGPSGQIRFANMAAENFFDTSALWLAGRVLCDLLPEDSPLFGLIGQVRGGLSSVSEYGVTLSTPRIGEHFVTAQVAQLPDEPDSVIVSLHEQSIARKIDHQLTHRNAARSVTAMAALLAHEVKNPLSGIRGAAQLLEQSAPAEDRELTRLICDETDRICALVDRMEVFSDGRPIEKGPVNIHAVLEHVRKVAQNGFAKQVRFIENYDPSLPPVAGSRDLLVQLFLNLVKNAAEAAPEKGGEIVLSTSYQHGVRLAVAASENRLQLPLLVSVQDNGDGIPDDLKSHLFDPFVTTKKDGTGLGLALAAKIVGDHGGIIEFDSEPRRTVFKVMLPLYRLASAASDADRGEPL
ncbi:MAG TPA: ATP-binding protein [Alphaproteobacteria bacterium]|nr:ATP-binding protein [Alphaproteobacteria bacterium]